MGRSQRHKATIQYETSDGFSVPYATAKPTLSGTATVGSTLTGVNGTFRGTPTPVVTRAWYRDDAVIAGQTAATYVLVTADKTHKVYFANIATSPRGPVTTSFSNPTVTIP